MKKIDIYTGVMCGYCDAAKHLLKKKKLEFNEINIATDPEKMDEVKKIKKCKNCTSNFYW